MKDLVLPLSAVAGVQAVVLGTITTSSRPIVSIA
jgi:hypothetical protein